MGPALDRGRWDEPDAAVQVRAGCAAGGRASPDGLGSREPHVVPEFDRRSGMLKIATAIGVALAVGILALMVVVVVRYWRAESTPCATVCVVQSR